MIQHIRKMHFPVGMRTIKTAIAVTLALFVVEHLGTSGAKVIFAVIGAIAAMENTLKAALRNCIAQIGGVAIGVVLAIIMRQFPLRAELAVCIGIVLTMALFVLLHWNQSPVLACLILVTICTDDSIVAHSYGLARIWDTAIGLGIGLAVNMLIMPYDNSKKIRRLMEKLDGDLIIFLEDMFDGDEHLPDPDKMQGRNDELEIQLAIFADQRLFHRRRQRTLLTQLQKCQDTARELLVEVRTLRNMGRAGRLTERNRHRLQLLGAKVPKLKEKGEFSAQEIVINYHVDRALTLREQLKAELEQTKMRKKR